MSTVRINGWYLTSESTGTHVRLTIADRHGAGQIVTMTPEQREQLIQALLHPTPLTAFEVHGTPVDGGYTTRDLRALAGRLDIPGRSAMTKPELIAAINGLRRLPVPATAGGM